MSNFFDAVCLVKFNHENGAFIDKFYPHDFNFLNQDNILSICSFPETQQDLSLHKNSPKYSITIYATTVNQKNCYILSFLYKNVITNKKEPNSIVIISHKAIASEIFKMLLDTRAFLLQLLNSEEEKKGFEYETKFIKNDNIKKKETSNNVQCTNDEIPVKSIPEIVFDKVWRCTQLCTFNTKTLILNIVTPIRTFKTVLSNDYVTYSQFDPNFWFSPQTNLYAIWRALMTNRGILIVGQSPSQVSCAVFSILSLAAPLKYCEPYIAYTRLGDPRFSEIIYNQSTKWKIVGTTNSLLAERCKQFSLIGILNPIEGERFHEIDPDYLQQKFLNEGNTVENNLDKINRNTNNCNSNSSFSLKKLDFFGLKLFNNNMNSIFSLQLNEASSNKSQSSSLSSYESFHRSMCCNSLRKATKKMMKLVEFRLNSKIGQEPYFDILEKKMCEEDFFGIFVASKSNQKSDSNKTTEKPKNNLNNYTNNHSDSTNNTNTIIDIFDNFKLDDNNIETDLNDSTNFYAKNSGIIINNDIENDDYDEINIDEIASNFSLPASPRFNTNSQIGKLKNISLIKHKPLSLSKHNAFNNHPPSSNASRITTFPYNMNKKLHPKINFFTTKDALRWQDSLTFEDWRKKITLRHAFRESFLSMTPEDALKNKNKDELLKIYDVLENIISKKYNSDMHMMAVVKRHIRIIKDKLKE